MGEDVTALLGSLGSGREEAFGELLARVYPELRQIAHARLRDRRRGHTLNTTGLVHEAYLRLVRYPDVRWAGRAHFFGAAAQTMRRVLVDYARARQAQKRSGRHVSLTGAGALSDEVPIDRVLEIDDALNRLYLERPRWARVVECRFFGGLTIEETAEALGVSVVTVSNDWRMARAWLRRALGQEIQG